MSDMANVLCLLNSSLGNFVKEADESFTKGFTQHRVLETFTWINCCNGFHQLKIDLLAPLFTAEAVLGFSEPNSATVEEWASWRHTVLKGDPTKLCLGWWQVTCFQWCLNGWSLWIPDFYGVYSQKSFTMFPLKCICAIYTEIILLNEKTPQTILNARSNSPIL